MAFVNDLDGRLLFAVPKKGRLQQNTLDLLRGSDIQFRREHRLDIALVKNLPIALVFLPAADIPRYVGQGRVDLGITGHDQVEEYYAIEGSGEKGCQTVLELGFGECKLQVQVPKDGKYATPADLVGKNIATSFVGLTKDFFGKLELAKSGNPNGPIPEKLQTKIMDLSGSVEAACALGVADGIVDLVESGETMRAAGLKAIDTVVESQAILIKSKSPTNPELVDLIASRIGGVITAQKYVLCQYNVQKDSLSKATAITPGKRAPTVNNLIETDWMAVSVMVEAKKIATAMDELAKVGATDILVLDIHNTRTR